MSVLGRRIAFLAAVAIAAAGCQSAAPERQNVGEYADDAMITAKVKTAIFNDPSLKAAEINVETYKGVVQLSGFAGSRDAGLRAAEIARAVGGVKAVKNDMQLK